MKTDATEAEVKEAALKEPNVAKHLEGLTIIKAIFVKNKLMNFVAK
jgi:leucyl-tRNA synthetase